MPQAARGPVVVAGAVGVGGVFDHQQLVLGGDGHDGVHVGHLPGEVYGDHRPGARRDGGIERLRIEIESLQVDVGKDRRHVGFDHGRGGGEERVGRNDDFAAGFDARGHQCDSQRDGAVDHGDAVAAAVHGGEALFELAHFVAVEPAPMAAAHRGQHARFVLLVEDGPARERTSANGLAAEQCESGHGGSRG